MRGSLLQIQGKKYLRALLPSGSTHHYFGSKTTNIQIRLLRLYCYQCGAHFLSQPANLWKQYKKKILSTYFGPTSNLHIIIFIIFITFIIFSTYNLSVYHRWFTIQRHFATEGKMLLTIELSILLSSHINLCMRAHDRCVIAYLGRVANFHYSVFCPSSFQ